MVANRSLGLYDWGVENRSSAGALQRFKRRWPKFKSGKAFDFFLRVKSRYLMSTSYLVAFNY